MNIAGVLVHARAGALGRVEAALLRLPGVEVHARSPEGRLVVTVEVEESEGCLAGETLVKMHDIPGVLSAAMIYHHFEADDVPGPDHDGE